MQPVHLRTATGAKSCANCSMYESLDEYKDLFRRYGPADPSVYKYVIAYKYGPEHLQKDGVCKTDGYPPVMKNEVCDSFSSFSDSKMLETALKKLEQELHKQRTFPVKSLFLRMIQGEWKIVWSYSYDAVLKNKKGAENLLNKKLKPINKRVGTYVVNMLSDCAWTIWDIHDLQSPLSDARAKKGKRLVNTSKESRKKK
jgi:hypothetical protein